MTLDIPFYFTFFSNLSTPSLLREHSVIVCSSDSDMTPCCFRWKAIELTVVLSISSFIREYTFTKQTRIFSVSDIGSETEMCHRRLYEGICYLYFRKSNEFLPPIWIGYLFYFLLLISSLRMIKYAFKYTFNKYRTLNP